MTPFPAPDQSLLNDLRSRPRPMRLVPRVQPYAWGDASFIPALLGEPPTGGPQAELWLGAHPAFPSSVEIGGALVPLDRLIAAAPDLFLGETVARRFKGRLPFLLKVLAASRPLSIQAHPDRTQAEAGFAARSVSYTDDNHKPELLVALTDFHALLGFRPPAEIAEELRAAPELSSLSSAFAPTAEGLKTLYSRVMSWPQDQIDALLSPLVHRLASEDARAPFPKSDRRHWLLRADALYSSGGRRDRGLFSIFLLNLVRLAPGEAVFSPAGVLHSYLEGAAVEVMANSDNVLRGGLTAKPVDVPELLRVLTFEGAPARVLKADAGGDYPSFVEDFALSVVDLKPGVRRVVASRGGAATGLVVEAGSPVSLEGGGETLLLGKGGAFFAPPGGSCALSCAGAARVFIASGPSGKG